MSQSKIVDLRGRPARQCGVTLEELEEKVRRQHAGDPQWPLMRVYQEAEHLYVRLGALHEVIEAGEAEVVGRELRRRWTTGLGIPVEPVPGMGEAWTSFIEQLQALAPRERGFVLGVLRQKVCA